MFVQVIQGTVSDAAELRAALDRWARDLSPGAQGWLGSTAGVTDDGTAIAIARFESEEAARRNSDRPDQHQWWMETSKLYSGDVTFHDCRDVVEWSSAGSDDAGFVQVMESTVSDLDRMKQLATEMDAAMRDIRPDILGGFTAVHADGRRTTDVIYFTSEAAAREGEKKEITGEAKKLFDEAMALATDFTYYDLREPWLYSPR